MASVHEKCGGFARISRVVLDFYDRLINEHVMLTDDVAHVVAEFERRRELVVAR